MGNVGYFYCSHTWLISTVQGSASVWAFFGSNDVLSSSHLDEVRSDQSHGKKVNHTQIQHNKRVCLFCLVRGCVGQVVSNRGEFGSSPVRAKRSKSASPDWNEGTRDRLSKSTSDYYMCRTDKTFPQVPIIMKPALQNDDPGQ